MRNKSLHKSVFAVALLVLMLILSGCMTSKPLKLGSWQDFRKEMLNKYDCIRRLEAEQFQPWLDINIYYSGELSDQTRADITEDFQAFLSGKEFLDEYVPYALARIDDSLTVQPPMPDINLAFLRSGTDVREYRSEANYYTEPYRSDREMEVDRYQTWRSGD